MSLINYIPYNPFTLILYSWIVNPAFMDNAQMNTNKGQMATSL